MHSIASRRVPLYRRILVFLRKEQTGFLTNVRSEIFVLLPSLVIFV